MSFIENLLLLIGRIFISSFFLWSVFEKVKNWKATADFMESKKVPQVKYVLPISMVVKIVGALMVLVGFYPRAGAVLLILLLAPSAIRFHDFWSHQGAPRASEMKLFMKDVAIVGGLFLLLAAGGGDFGV